METLTTCPVCYSRYTHNDHLPLILSCGHTFCKICVSQISKCPLCRKTSTSAATNLLVFQVNSAPSKPCSHSPRYLYCPLCSYALCLECVVYHNLHGVLPLSDSSISPVTKEKLESASKKLKDSNKLIQDTLNRIGLLHNKINIEKEEYVINIKEKIQEVREALDQKELELLEELECMIRPITSKLEGISAEFQAALKFNKAELKYIEDLGKMEIKDQIEKFRTFQVRSINAKIVDPIGERAEEFKGISFDIEKLLLHIKDLGKPEIPLHKKFFNF
ncbi:unnamed protein product [Blepharisma stoltei]|uniref:RING-type domain-containing protein n=1 Tax=Blepharisma stoltei TaxID=1481888 RepID=A0AAU9K1R0_9CILI|nr:unnamed protein product [Blepharisma stoltei]